MTEQEVVAAALSDPDAHPLTPDDFKRMRGTPRAKIIRRALGLTQEEFAARFGIPLGTLRDCDWPDMPRATAVKDPLTPPDPSEST